MRNLPSHRQSDKILSDTKKALNENFVFLVA